LAGVAVVECGQGVAAAFATKLLALLGAKVIKVEPPQGDITRQRGPFFDDAYDPEASGLFLYLNADKYGVVLDLNSASDRARLDDLLAQADILIHNIPVPERAALKMETDAVCRSHPGLIVAGISPFGDYGPHARYKAYEINVAHASRMASVGPGGSPFPEPPPLKLFGQQAEFQGALNAAMAVSAAYLDRMKTGAGQGIEVSEQECMTAILEGTLVQYTYAGREASRLGRYAYGPRAIFPCADGWLHINLGEEAQWQRMVELMGNPEWTQEEIFKDRLLRGANCDALEPLLAEWTRNWKMLDLYLAAQAKHVPVAPVNRASDVYSDGHLRARNFFVSSTGTAVDTVAIPIYNIGVLMEIQSASAASNPTPISSPSASSAPTPTATTAGDPSPIPTPTSTLTAGPSQGTGGAFPLESSSLIGSALESSIPS
jgi:crotonobetainyl-CoA:carnitine CoA-transferase CaiB-like acyl-CoA transferase